MTFRLACTITLSSLLAACGPVVEKYDGPLRYSVAPISSYAIPYGQSLKRLERLAYIENLLAGYIRYDSVRQPPTPPDAALPVSCADTDTIGIYFLLVENNRRHTALSREGMTTTRVPLRFTWEHPTVDTSESRYDRFHTEIWNTRNSDGDMIYSHRLKLKEDDKKDGWWTVEVRHRGDLLYEESFELKDCGKPYQPDWFDKQD